jgi:hypothetical protein
MEAAKASLSSALSSGSPLTPLWTSALATISSSDGSHRILSNYLVTLLSQMLGAKSYKLTEEDTEGCIIPALANLQAGTSLKGKDNFVRRQVYQFYLDEGEYYDAATVLATVRSDDGVKETDDYYLR